MLTMYAEDVTHYDEAIKSAVAALERKAVPRDQWPVAVTEGLPPDEGGVEVQAPAVDPTMAAFMA